MGWPYDTTAAMYRIVFSGVFERHPTIRIITHHHGGFVPYYQGGMRGSWAASEEEGRDLSDKVSRPYIDHFKKFYCDTACKDYVPKVLELALDFFGPERMLFGSDTPFGAGNGQSFTSGALIYSDASGEADFTGGLRAEMGEATVRADTGTVYLKKDNPKAASTASKMPSLNGRIDHVAAKGQITIAQPGLHATGEQLLYTGAEQSFLLTGDAKNLPKAMDARGNVTTGAALKFRRACSGGGGDTTVEVLNKAPSGLDIPGGVHTEVLAEEKKGRPSR